MSTRPQLSPQVVMNASMATTQTSQPTIIQKLSMISYTYTWTGATPIGAISVEVSNNFSLDPSGQVSNAGTWDTLPLSASTAVTGNTGSGQVDILQTGAYAIRTVYTATSGTGTIKAIINAKVA